MVWVEGFGKQLAEDNFARWVFVRQVVTTGFPIVLATNLVAGMVYAAVRNAGVKRATGLQYFLFDVIVRFIAFTTAMAATYYASAVLFESFGGNTERALSAVWPTLAGAFRFENLTSAFILAALLGGVPIFASAVVDLSERSSLIQRTLQTVFSHLPLSDKPVLATTVTFSVLAYLVFQFGAYVITA